jgi:thiol-disulfide isomerase/thioredoxin
MQTESNTPKKVTPWYADFRLFFLVFVVLALFMLKAVFGSGYGCGGPSFTNKRAPAFEVAGLTSQTVSLDSLRGKVVFLNFWATWCKPCVNELPAIQDLYKRYEGRQDFAVVAIACDESETQAVREFVIDFNKKSTSATPVTFPMYHDAAQKIAPLYGVSGFPTSFLIDKQGRVRKYFIGPRDYNNRHFFAMVDELLKE